MVQWLGLRFRSERLRVWSRRSVTFTPSVHVRRQSLPVRPPKLNNCRSSRWSPADLLWLTKVAVLDDIETAFTISPRKRAIIAWIFKNINISWGSEVNWCNHPLAFSEVRVHAGTTQVDFEDYHQSPADFPSEDLFQIHLEVLKIIWSPW